MFHNPLSVLSGAVLVIIEANASYVFLFAECSVSGAITTATSATYVIISL